MLLPILLKAVKLILCVTSLPTTTQLTQPFFVHCYKDTFIDHTHEVDMVVVDGISMGHRLCAFRMCTNSPTDYVSRKFCVEHSRSHGHLCGVAGCEQEIASHPPNTKACSNPSHQALWQKYRGSTTRESYAGFCRIVRHQRAEIDSGVGRFQEPWEVNAQVAQAELAAMRIPDDPETAIPHHHPGPTPTDPASPAPSGLKHNWSYRCIHVIEIVTWPCGCPVAWAKFPNSESPTNIINLLTELYPREESCPTFITIDKACRVLATLQSRGLADIWFRTTRFLVDTFHFQTHKEETHCQTFCNPSPMDGSQPDLVIPIQGNYGAIRLHRAFNTETAEHLNSWFVGYSGILSHMRAENHDFLIQVMLEYHFQARQKHLT